MAFDVLMISFSCSIDMSQPMFSSRALVLVCTIVFRLASLQFTVITFTNLNAKPKHVTYPVTKAANNAGPYCDTGQLGVRDQ